LSCPECGRSFSRPAALGAHRSRVHGVAGNSQNARSRRSRTTPATTTQPPRTRTQTANRTNNGATRPNVRSGVDHDALLRALFPDGIPPRQETIAAVNTWLAQADLLARRR
jgi:hypothetical protein